MKTETFWDAIRRPSLGEGYYDEFGNRTFSIDYSKIIDKMKERYFLYFEGSFDDRSNDFQLIFYKNPLYKNKNSIIITFRNPKMILEETYFNKKYEMFPNELIDYLENKLKL